MALLKILEFPDPRLRTIAEPVEVIDEKIKKLAKDMLETMYNAEGIGLAATQINFHQRLIVIDVSEKRDNPLVFINPKIEILDDDLQEYKEGCLSVPGYYESVNRPCKIRVKAMDQDGHEFEMEPEGVLSVCIQHEIDHLNGKLFVDHISSLKRNRIKQKLQKDRR